MCVLSISVINPIISEAEGANCMYKDHKTCQRQCDEVVVKCYADAGYTFGNVTNSSSIPALKHCNEEESICMKSCENCPPSSSPGQAQHQWKCDGVIAVFLLLAAGTMFGLLLFYKSSRRHGTDGDGGEDNFIAQKYAKEEQSFHQSKIAAEAISKNVLEGQSAIFPTHQDLVRPLLSFEENNEKQDDTNQALVPIV